ncbi:MFS transporter [Paramicrobacterium chengjingii]|uniref:MFS transporter n=1 Tax=Paramicrobacterium chengjingii TaxID=2769067 RepID=UPI00141E505A|nr:MFS transporter [Microbacterium chengjingii]
MQKIQRPIIFFLIFATMFVLGGIQNTKGIVLEQIQKDIQIDISQIGLMVTVFQIGFLLASLVAGILADRRGVKVVMIVGAVMMIVGLFGTSVAFDVLFFLGFYLVVGLGIGTMTVSVATLIPTYFRERSGVVFNVANAFFGIGMVVTPLILNAMFAQNVSWRTFYVGGAVVVVVILLALTAFRQDAGVEKNPEDAVTLLSVVRLFADRQVLLVVLFILFYVATEAGFLNFFPILYSSLELDGVSAADKVATAGFVVSSFALLFTIGRFAGGLIIYKLGERRTLLYFSIFALLSLIVGRIFLENATYIFIVFGLAMSVLFPTAQGVGAKLTTKSGSLQGLIYVASGLGGAAVGVAIGEVSALVGIEDGFNLLIVFAALFCVCALLIRVPSTDADSQAALGPKVRGRH